jgi:hypothetical protein
LIGKDLLKKRLLKAMAYRMYKLVAHNLLPTITKRAPPLFKKCPQFNPDLFFTHPGATPLPKREALDIGNWNPIG